MAYDLVIQGIRDFARLDRVVAQQKISRDPLSGVLDGSNRVFHTNYRPILSSGSVFVYEGLSAIPGAVDVDTGEITAGSAPSVQPVATYTFIPYTIANQLSFLIGGFYQMETLWTRGWALEDAAGDAANEDSDNIYMVSGASDPLTGQPAQIGFYMACCRYFYILAQLTGGAVTDYDWRETVRGMAITRSRRPGNLALALEAAGEDMQRALENLQDYVLDGSGLGGFVGNPMTSGYVDGLEWQQDSLNRNLRGQRGYSRSVIPLSV